MFARRVDKYSGAPDSWIAGASMTGTDDRTTVTPAADADPLISHRYDWTDTDPSTAVVETLAVAINREPLNTDPLYESVDPDALNALFDPGAGGTTPDLRVSFQYQDFLVAVSASGTISITPLEDVEN